MPINAITLIFENIEDKTKAFNDENRPRLEEELKTLAETGINDDGNELAEIIYVQNTTGNCDYAVLLQSKNVEKLMKAINVIRQIEQVNKTESHIGQIIFLKKGES